MRPRYVFDELNAPRLERFGKRLIPVAHIEIGKHRAADFYYRDELPDEGRVAYLLERQGFKLVGYPADDDLRMVAYMREADK